MSKLYTVDDNGIVTVVTASGWTVECQPVADLLMRTGQNLTEPEPPDPPTYTIEGVGGATEERTYDAEGIEDQKTPQEDKDKWIVYLEKKAAYDSEVAAIEAKRNEMRGRFMALRGVKVRNLPDQLDDWAAEQRLLYGFEIEDNGLPHTAALKLAFIDQEVIRTPEDGGKITAGILRASGLDQEALDSVEATFLDSLGQAGRPDTEGDTDVPTEAG